MSPISLAREGSLLEANRKGRARCDVPGAVCHRTGEGNAQRPWSHRPQEQPLLPGPGNNDNKALGRVQKTSRWSAERRGVGSLRRRALASKSESPRAVMHAHRMQTQHPGAYRRSARPSSGAANKKKEDEREMQTKIRETSS
jgi:hypothetical protein